MQGSRVEEQILERQPDATLRQPYLVLAAGFPDHREYLWNALSAPLGRNNHTRVKDQSHGCGVQGCHLRTVSSTSRAKSGSSVTACPRAAGELKRPPVPSLCRYCSST